MRRAPDHVRITLAPRGEVIEQPPGQPLQDALFRCGIEFPCGGRGRCRGCRVRMLEGKVAISEDDERLLSAGELAAGWRLACRVRPSEDITIEVAQWRPAVLDDRERFAFTPREGLGIALDLGTTTLVAQLVDLSTADILAVETALNPQAVYGADVMSRIQAAVDEGEQRVLENVVRRALGRLIDRLVARHPSKAVVDIVIVGNTVMHHLFSGIDLAPLARYPFEPLRLELQLLSCRRLGWRLAGEPPVRFLPCAGGFVGSDVLAGVMATGLVDAAAPAALVDLGTNGEVVIGSRERLLSASAAAGSAFEGARIAMGMRAATGAVARVRVEAGALHPYVIGGGRPRGICGSGIVDAVAAARDLGLIDRGGRITTGDEVLPVAPPVALTQCDIRELQLAKGAVAAASRLLLARLGLPAGAVTRVHLAGAFGNAIDGASARRIGLIEHPAARVEAAGNTALRGARMALFLPGDRNAGDGPFSRLARTVEHVPLGADDRFEDVFVQSMALGDGS